MPRRCAFRSIVLLVMSAAAVTSLLLSTISWTEAQSFNCRYAKTPDEVLICRDSGLAQLDEQMASVFFSVRNSVTREKQTSLDAGSVRGCVPVCHAGGMLIVLRQFTASALLN